MSKELLTTRINALANAVLADWRWIRDDLNVAVVGMLLYGLARAIARESGLSVAEVDDAVSRCMTEQVGAAAKWSRSLVADANASADDKAHHPGQHEIIGVGKSYFGIVNQQAVVNNVFANFASVRKRSGLPEPNVAVFLNPLALLLIAREREKGSPLTEAEVLAIRDGALCTPMSLSQAEKFYAALDSKTQVPRLNPERIWEEWQEVRAGIIDS